MPVDKLEAPVSDLKAVKPDTEKYQTEKLKEDEETMETSGSNVAPIVIKPSGAGGIAVLT